MDPNRMIWPLKRVGFGFDFHPPEKFGSSLGQSQTRPVDTPTPKCLWFVTVILFYDIDCVHYFLLHNQYY